MKINDIFYLSQGPGKPYKCYVRGIIDECMVVYKWYGRHKQWWHYEIKHMHYLKSLITRTKSDQN